MGCEIPNSMQSIEEPREDTFDIREWLRECAIKTVSGYMYGNGGDINKSYFSFKINETYKTLKIEKVTQDNPILTAIIVYLGNIPTSQIFFVELLENLNIK